MEILPQYVSLNHPAERRGGHDLQIFCINLDLKDQCGVHVGCFAGCIPNMDEQVA